MGFDVFGKNPSKSCGEHFRATIWSWRPLHWQMEQLCSDLLSKELLREMDFNDGAGPDDQATCTEIADRFERALAVNPDGFTFEQDLFRVNESGHFISDEELKQNGGLKTYSPYRACREAVLSWIEFLRHCGGFEVF